MKKTRKIIAIILCVSIALSVFTIMAGMVLNKTIFNQTFVAENLITEDLQTECDNQLKLKLNVLEKKSNIPAKVFKKVIEDKPASQIMKRNVENFFSGRDTSLNSADTTDYFYNLCIDYLNENGFQYNEKDIMNTATEATRLYSDSRGFKNIEHLKLYMDQMQKDIKYASMIAAIYLVIACILIYSMYSNYKQALKIYSQSVIASGVSGIIAAIILYFTGFGIDLPISPEAYMQGFNNLADKCYLVFSLSSLAIMVAGIVFTILVDKSIRKDAYRKEGRFSKRIDIMK